MFVNDPAAQLEAKRRIRIAFRSAKVPTPKDREKQLLIANDTARLLRDSVVQAVYKEDGKRYKASFKDIHMSTKAETELI